VKGREEDLDAIGITSSPQLAYILLNATSFFFSKGDLDMQRVTDYNIENLEQIE
jgi:hypothetical protein